VNKLPTIDEQMRMRKLKKINEYLQRELVSVGVSERKALLRAIFNFLFDVL